MLHGFIYLWKRLFENKETDLFIDVTFIDVTF